MRTFIVYLALASLWMLRFAASASPADQLVPPVKLAPFVAECIRKMPPQIDRVLVCQSSHRLVELQGKPVEVEKLPDALGRALFSENATALSEWCGEDNGVRQLCRVDVCIGGTTGVHIPAPMEAVVIDGVYTYLLSGANGDAAKTVLDKVRRSPEVVSVQTKNCELIKRTTSNEVFYAWSPRKNVLNILRGANLSSAALKQWDGNEPQSNQFAWGRSEWKHVDLKAATWMIRIARERDRQGTGFSGVSIWISKTEQASSIDVVWHGFPERSSLRRETGGSDQFGIPDDFDLDLKVIEGTGSMAVIHLPNQAGPGAVEHLVFFLKQVYFGGAGPWGL